MTSAAKALNHLHEAAAKECQLDISQIKVFMSPVCTLFTKIIISIILKTITMLINYCYLYIIILNLILLFQVQHIIVSMYRKMGTSYSVFLL